MVRHQAQSFNSATIMKFFYFSINAYEQFRNELDTLLQLPNNSGTITSIEPAITAPCDIDGNILLAISLEFYTNSIVTDLISKYSSNNKIEEIDQETYRAKTIRDF